LLKTLNGFGLKKKKTGEGGSLGEKSGRVDKDAECRADVTE